MQPAAPAAQIEQAPLSSAEAKREARRKELEARRAEAAPQLEAEKKPSTAPLRPLDRTVLQFLENGPPEKGKGEDIFPKDKAKVTVLAGEDPRGEYRASRVDIDLDRDGQVDEVWRLNGKQITRRRCICTSWSTSTSPVARMSPSNLRRRRSR
jgi:hypothetical protein